MRFTIVWAQSARLLAQRPEADLAPNPRHAGGIQRAAKLAYPAKSARHPTLAVTAVDFPVFRRLESLSEIDASLVGVSEMIASRAVLDLEMSVHGLKGGCELAFYLRRNLVTPQALVGAS